MATQWEGVRASILWSMQVAKLIRPAFRAEWSDTSRPSVTVADDTQLEKEIESRLRTVFDMGGTSTSAFEKTGTGTGAYFHVKNSFVFMNDLKMNNQRSPLQSALPHQHCLHC